MNLFHDFWLLLFSNIQYFAILCRMSGNKIYTKSGDQGYTKLANAESITKDSETIEACGTIDELNSYLGLTILYIKDSEIKQKLQRTQQELVIVNARLALASATKIITIEHVQTLECEIDEMSEILPQIESFIVAVQTKAAAHLQIARTICRRAERMVVKLAKVNKLTEITISYLNRLSDWLFTLARFVEEQNAT